MKKLLVLVGFVCVLSLFAGAALAATATVRGKVTGQLQPEVGDKCRGMVSLWPVAGHPIDDPGLYNTVPYWTAKLLSDCRFEVSAPSDRYYLRGIIRRTPGVDEGPLRAGDLLFMSPDMDGEVLQVEVNAEIPIDVGIHSSSREFSGFSSQVATGIVGRVIHFDGRPISGLLVLAFSDREMSAHLIAVSEPSDDNGEFKLRLAEAGNVYLQARESLRFYTGRDNELFGVYGGKRLKDLKPVTVKPGEPIEGLKILVR